MNFKRGDELAIEIHDFAFGGNAISRLETEEGKFAIFVQNGIPGQKVKVRVTKKRKKHAECKLIDVIEPSKLEIPLPYQNISGAPYLNLPIELQHQFKKETTFDVLKKLGDFPEVADAFDEFIPSPLPFNYRNKMEYSFSVIRHDLVNNSEVDDFGLGFKHTGTWWKVENLDKESGLFDAQMENNLKEIRIYLEKTGLPAWHPPKKEGFFRHLVVRKSFYQNQLLINLVTSTAGLDQFDRKDFSNFLVSIFKERLGGFIHTTNDDVADRAKFEHGPSDLLHGNAVIIESVLGLKFEISMQSFFQTNPKSAEKLYSKVLDYAFEDGNLDNQVIMDLFCGTGTIAQLLASRTRKTEIIGVDIVESAIANAKRNASLNKIEDVKFFASDVGKFLKEYPQYVGKIGTIILDPPRAGIIPKTLQNVIQLKADRIVYVSCNPATQARDMKDLRMAGYNLKKFSLVDQFPHTAHIESIMLFEKD